MVIESTAKNAYFIQKLGFLQHWKTLTSPIWFQVYYKIFCAARKIVLEEKRAQSHLEAYCHLNIDQQLPPPIIHPQTNLDIDKKHSPIMEHHRSSSASTTVRYFLSLHATIIFFLLKISCLNSGVRTLFQEIHGWWKYVN